MASKFIFYFYFFAPSPRKHQGSGMRESHTFFLSPVDAGQLGVRVSLEMPAWELAVPKGKVGGPRTLTQHMGWAEGGVA